MNETRNKEWINGFSEGMPVMYGNRVAHVVAVPRRVVPEDQVPVMYDDESGCYVIVHWSEIQIIH